MPWDFTIGHEASQPAEGWQGWMADRQAGQARVVGWANKTEEKETGERFEVSQVKDKFGTLRFYGNHHTDAIDGRFEQAAVEALHTCETCGWEGRQREPGGANACDEHAQDLG